MKKVYILNFIICLIALCIFSTPKYSLASSGDNRESQLLNGIWDFYPDGGATKYEVVVPSYWDVPEGFGFPNEWNNLEHGIYKKTFTVPASMDGKEIFLHFDRISLIGKVFVNGQEVTEESSGGYLMGFIPYKLDVTSYVNVGSTNELEVRLWSYASAPADAKDSGGELQYAYGQDDRSYGQGRGISGDVILSSSSKVYISDVYIITDLKKNTDSSDDTITIQATVTNKTTSDQTILLENKAALIGGNQEKIFNNQNATIGANSSQVITLTDIPWSDAAYWWTDDPSLYTLHTTIKQNNVELDALSTRFGFRQFYRESNYFVLNGVKTNLLGDSGETVWHEFHPHGPDTSSSLTYADSSIDQIKQMLDEWKALNMNVLRTHTGGAIKEIYEYADEIGLLIIDESKFNNYKVGSLTSSALANNADWITRWVKANRNHPSIVIWGASNECWEWDVKNYLLPVLNTNIKANDTTRPIIHDGNNMEDENNKHYDGGYPAGRLNNANLYGLYSNDPSIPKGEGECFTPSQGWPILNANGTIQSLQGGKDYTSPDIMSQAERHRAVCRMVRGIRYAGYADIRPYANWRYAFEVIEKTIKPEWSDITTSGLKPVSLDRPIINVYDASVPTVIPSESYTYMKNSFSPVAVFDKEGDNNNRIGVDPTIYTAGSNQSRTLIIYNDEQRHGTDIEVLWEAGYYNPTTDSYTSFDQGSFTKSVAYGSKAEHSIQFTLPNNISQRWLQLKLTAKKGTETKFQEINVIGSIDSHPPAELEASTSNHSNLGIIDMTNKGQLRKIKLINRGGGLSTNWTATNIPQWMNLTLNSGNLRGEQDIYYDIDLKDLLPNTEYTDTITFSEDGGTTDSITISFTTGTDFVPEVVYTEDFESGSAQDWVPTSGTWNVIQDGNTNVYQQTDNLAAATRSVYSADSWDNYEVTVDLKVESFGNDWSAIGIDIRHENFDNTYFLKFYKKGNILSIRKRVNGVTTVLADKSFNFQTGQWYTFTAVANGNNLELWVEDVKEITVTDSELTTGKAGLLSHRTHAKFDNVIIKEYH